MRLQLGIPEVVQRIGADFSFITWVPSSSSFPFPHFPPFPCTFPAANRSPQTHLLSQRNSVIFRSGIRVINAFFCVFSLKSLCQKLNECVRIELVFRIVVLGAPHPMRPLFWMQLHPLLTEVGVYGSADQIRPASDVGGYSFFATKSVQSVRSRSRMMLIYENTEIFPSFSWVCLDTISVHATSGFAFCLRVRTTLYRSTLNRLFDYTFPNKQNVLKHEIPCLQTAAPNHVRIM